MSKPGRASLHYGIPLHELTLKQINDYYEHTQQEVMRREVSRHTQKMDALNALHELRIAHPGVTFFWSGKKGRWMDSTDAIVEGDDEAMGKVSVPVQEPEKLTRSRVFPPRAGTETLGPEAESCSEVSESGSEGEESDEDHEDAPCGAMACRDKKCACKLQKGETPMEHLHRVNHMWPTCYTKQDIIDAAETLANLRTKYFNPTQPME